MGKKEEESRVPERNTNEASERRRRVPAKYRLLCIDVTQKKNRRKREVLSLKWLFWCTIFIFSFCFYFTGSTFLTFRLLRESFHPVLIFSGQNSAIEASSGEFFPSPAIKIQETVVFPDKVLIFLKYPSSVPKFTKHDLTCVYSPRNSSQPYRKLTPTSIDDQDSSHQIVRCPIYHHTFTVTVASKSNGQLLMGPTYKWDSLVYEALIDRDNSTILFVKGLNLRSEKIYDSSRCVCVYGSDFMRPKLLLTSEVISIAQEIVRCRTPLSLLNKTKGINKSIKVSIRVKGRGLFPSMARPEFRPESYTKPGKLYEMCTCTMVRNQARFLREWVMYHTQIGVQRWFIYDNNSDDSIENVIASLDGSNYNITRHIWPWIKSQEAGFAHCALQARDTCEWVGFIDVDEFLYLPANRSLLDVLRAQSGLHRVGEVRITCYSFGPSGLKKNPVEGVMVGYTCRMGAPERHKSIVRPEALDQTLINVVHHFHLKDGFEYVDMNKGVMVINHYKYQVWEVFKEKFYRRVATYVADWQVEEKVGSKDRAPGLGTRAVEPPDWSTRFCEVKDTRLRDRVLWVFADPHTHLLPWQEQKKNKENKSR